MSSRLQYCLCKIITKPVHSHVICIGRRRIGCIPRGCMSCVSFRYRGHIIWIWITSPKMSIKCMIFMNEVMEAHGSCHNHLLLRHWVTWHLEKNSPLHLPYTKSPLDDISKTGMQKVKVLLLTTRGGTPPPVRNMVPFSLVW